VERSTFQVSAAAAISISRAVAPALRMGSQNARTELEPPDLPAAAGTAAAESQNGASPDKAVEVIIIQDPGEREAIPTVIGNVKPEGNQNGDSTAPPASTSFSRLQPRGIGG
jgi:hypothetical protein